MPFVYYIKICGQELFYEYILLRWREGK